MRPAQGDAYAVRGSVGEGTALFDHEQCDIALHANKSRATEGRAPKYPRRRSGTKAGVVLRSSVACGLDKVVGFTFHLL